MRRRASAPSIIGGTVAAGDGSDDADVDVERLLFIMFDDVKRHRWPGEMQGLAAPFS